MASTVDAIQEEFLACARYGELDEMKAELAKGADANGRGPGGQTALHMACANGHEEIVRALLEAGADASLANDAGNTPAHYAAQQKHGPCLRLVLAGQDVLKRNEFGKSTLTEAIASGDAACATIALEHESAAEEKIIAGLDVAEGDDAATVAPAGDVTHALAFGATTVRVREKPIAGARDDALGDGAGATDRTGLGVWAAALVLARWLVDEGPAKLAGKRVVELGAGCGVGALALAAAVPDCSVAATDCAAETLENCAHNVDLFAADFGNGDAAGPLGAAKRVSSSALDWDAPPAPGATHCDVVVGADLVYHEKAVDKLCKTVVALGAAEFWYAAPATGRAGGPELLARLERLGFAHAARPAPAAYAASPLADAAQAALYFPDLAGADVVLHTFARPVPPTVDIQALAYLVKEDLARGPLAEDTYGTPQDIPAELCKGMTLSKDCPTRESLGIGPRGEFLGVDAATTEREKRAMAAVEENFPYDSKEGSSRWKPGEYPPGGSYT